MSTELNLSMELPYNYLDRFSAFEDLGFCIAPYILEEARYAYHYSDRLKSQIVIMDNGAYELGRPLASTELQDAVTMITMGGPLTNLYIIAPDHPTNKALTIKNTLAFRDAFPEYADHLAAVVQGDTYQEQLDCYQLFAQEGFPMICFSFLWNRPYFLGMKPHFYSHVKHHLLGCYGIKEILWMRTANVLPANCSIDTVKPLKAAIKGNHISDHLRGGGKWKPTIMLTPEQEKLYRINCAALYATCHTYIPYTETPLTYTRPTDTYSDARGIKVAE